MWQDCEGFCKWIPTLCKGQMAQRIQGNRLALLTLGASVDTEVYGTRRRLTRVVRETQHPIVTRGYIGVCCNRLERFIQ